MSDLDMSEITQATEPSADYSAGFDDGLQTAQSEFATSAARIASLEAELVEARADALEEAAKAAEINGWAGNRHRRAIETADDIAAAIRALKAHP